MSGEVTSAAGNNVSLNLTSDDNVRPGAYVLLIYKEPDQMDPDSGEIIWRGAEQVLGRARVERVTEKGAQAVLVDVQQEGVPVEQGMPAVTM